MKFTLSWLKDHLDTTAPLDEIVETLTRIGLEVEGVADKAKALAAFTIARVIEAKPHPNADRLRVCLVETGSGEPVQVVCGAPNARTGMTSVFAPPGAYIPGKDMTLGVGAIRGVESRGMLVSGFELKLSDDHEGILDLPDDAPVGEPFAAYAGRDDPVIEINLTPNRPDCASVHGVARDLAAAGLGKLKPDAAPPVRGAGPCPVKVMRDLEPGDEKLCPTFALRLVRGVRNGPSPAWMQRRLAAIGLRPINALVDITNYITFDRGRPLHVFDAKKVKGNLTVRRAKQIWRFEEMHGLTPEKAEDFKRAGHPVLKGADAHSYRIGFPDLAETLLALDGREYPLDPDMVVIADESGVESLAGIMGGERTGCDEATTDVLIESALWDPLNIAQTGRKLGIVTDARYRFERGVDPAFCLPGLDLATRMVMDLCGGEASERVVAGAPPDAARVIEFPWREIERLSGLDVPQPEAKVILEDLGFQVSGAGERARVTPPSWRPDVEGKADLVEEVIRITGLDRIEPQPLARLEAAVAKPILTVIQKRTRLAKRLLATRGLVEAVTWSFIARDEAKLFGGGDKRLALANPIASDLSDMRPSLLPGLLKAAQRNADRGFGDIALFEVGQCFASDEPDGQTVKAAAVRRGTARAEGVGRHWDGGAVLVDAFDAKADALALLAALGVQTGGLQVAPGGPDWLHPGRSGALRFGLRDPVGAFGEVHPKILKALDLKGPLVAFEITLDRLPLPKHRPTRMKPRLVLPEFQPVTRDFAFVVGRDVAAADILRAAQGAERALIAGVDVFDVYEGPGIEPDKKSVAIAVTLQPTEKTLTEAEIDAVSAKIVAEVTKRTGGALRAG